jgi:ribosomal protein S4
MSFARVDGRNVISLQFNPYELDDQQKKKVYDSAVKDLVEQREKIKSISKQAKEKQEQSNIKRAWLNIVKKDIPKAFRGYQKYKADLENNTKKQS